MLTSDDDEGDCVEDSPRKEAVSRLAPAPSAFARRPLLPLASGDAVLPCSPLVPASRHAQAFPLPRGDLPPRSQTQPWASAAGCTLRAGQGALVGGIPAPSFTRLAEQRPSIAVPPVPVRHFSFACPPQPAAVVPQLAAAASQQRSSLAVSQPRLAESQLHRSDAAKQPDPGPVGGGPGCSGEGTEGAPPARKRKPPSAGGSAKRPRAAAPAPAGQPSSAPRAGSKRGNFVKLKLGKGRSFKGTGGRKFVNGCDAMC